MSPRAATPATTASGSLAASRPQTGGQWLRLVGNAVNLTTLLGLGVATLGRARIRRGPRGLLLAERYRLRFPVASAFTVGSVIITSSTFDARLSELPGLVVHEERHTWQYLACLGLPFYPLYVLCMGWSVLRTGDRSSRNFFERQAGLELGGYRDVPIRPISVTIRRLLAWFRAGREDGKRHVS
jgi:hypothetical protein